MKIIQIEIGNSGEYLFSVKDSSEVDSLVVESIRMINCAVINRFSHTGINPDETHDPEDFISPKKVVEYFFDLQKAINDPDSLYFDISNVFKNDEFDKIFRILKLRSRELFRNHQIEGILDGRI